MVTALPHTTEGRYIRIVVLETSDESLELAVRIELEGCAQGADEGLDVCAGLAPEVNGMAVILGGYT